MLVLALSLGVVAAADAPPADPGAPADGAEVGALSESAAVASPHAFSAGFGAFYRVGGASFSPLRVDADGRRFGQTYWADHRLDGLLALHLGERVSLEGDLQLAAGYLAVDEPSPRFATFGPPRDLRAAAFGKHQSWLDQQLELRKLYVDWRLPFGVVMAGRMTSAWGLGILTSSGDDEAMDWGEPHFGDDRGYGDIVNRVLLATTPLTFALDDAWARNVSVAFGGDVLERDEHYARAAGDRGLQALGALRYRDERHEAGAYVVYRDLRDRHDDTLQALVFDLFGRGSWRHEGLELKGAAEIAVIDGAATVARNVAFPGEADVAQLGWVARVGATLVSLGAGGDLEVGYASGDSNPADGHVRGFSFDSDYNPSLILFEELHAAETVAAAAHASDPALVGRPADAVRLIPSGGSVTNAIYVRPTARYRAGDLTARLALLWARAEEDVVDPYTLAVTSRAGNFQGGAASARNLGVEVDAGVDYTFHVAGQPAGELVASLQAGRLWPGAAFADAAGRRPHPINLGFIRLAARLPEQRTGR